MNLRKMVPLAVLVAAVLPAGAGAPPRSVKATSKTASFSGTITDPTQMYDLIGFFAGSTEVGPLATCMAPYCEEHTLTVGPDGAELRLDATSDAYNLDLEIIDPAGTYTEVNDEGIPEHTLTLDPVPGDWTIRVYGAPELDSFDYTVKATFRTPEDVENDPAAEETE
jgi:hypothetical protein